MKLRIEDRHKAIELRKLGYTYNEIRSIIPNLSKGTLSPWMRHIVLSDLAIDRLKSKMQEGRDRARFQALIVNRKRREERELMIIKEAQREFEIFKKEHLFYTGLALYLAEGSKKSGFFQFINSSPEIIQLMGLWIERYLCIPKEKWRIRLYTHQLYAHEHCEKFWSSIIDMPEEKFHRTIYKPTPHTVKKNPNYKGCLRIDTGGIDTIRKIMAWEKCLFSLLLMRP